MSRMMQTDNSWVTANAHSVYEAWDGILLMANMFSFQSRWRQIHAVKCRSGDCRHHLAWYSCMHTFIFYYSGFLSWFILFQLAWLSFVRVRSHCHRQNDFVLTGCDWQCFDIGECRLSWEFAAGFSAYLVSELVRGESIGGDFMEWCNHNRLFQCWSSRLVQRHQRPSLVLLNTLQHEEHLQNQGILWHGNVSKRAWAPIQIRESIHMDSQDYKNAWFIVGQMQISLLKAAD